MAMMQPKILICNGSPLGRALAGFLNKKMSQPVLLVDRNFQRVQLMLQRPHLFQFDKTQANYVQLQAIHESQLSSVDLSQINLAFFLGEEPSPEVVSSLPKACKLVSDRLVNNQPYFQIEIPWEVTESQPGILSLQVEKPLQLLRSPRGREKKFIKLCASLGLQVVPLALRQPKAQKWVSWLDSLEVS